MPTYTKVFLSASPAGFQIPITGAAGTAGSILSRTDIHTPPANVLDEVWLYATNTSTSSTLNLTTYWGNTGSSGQMTTQIPPIGGRILIVDGKLLSGTSNTISAFATSGNFINIDGFVNRIT